MASTLAQKWHDLLLCGDGNSRTYGTFGLSIPLEFVCINHFMVMHLFHAKIFLPQSLLPTAFS
jgi:hypothetical protein